MAKQIKSMPTPGKRSYPWEEWMNGKPWAITHGEDFTCGIDSMRIYLYKRAETMGVKVSTSVFRHEPRTIYFQFTLPAPKGRIAKRRSK